ncbi:MAG: helicase C-terminal domain-containing protein [Candidatus Cloacimonetes bacterium]|nr:helicase C-terminal domain-containing protein [Candidatus Cloacimonadota bacterium]
MTDSTSERKNYPGLSFVAIDVETTGLDAQKDEIIELAAIRFENGIVAASFDSFVRPHKSVPKFIEFLTHISPQDLKQAPRIDTVLKEFLDFTKDSVLVGHNISFDLGFINHSLIKCGRLPLFNKSWDTAELSRFYLPYLNDHKLSSLTEHFGVSLENAHRADADATATGEVLCKMTNFVINHYPMSLNMRLAGLAKQAQIENANGEFISAIAGFQQTNSLLMSRNKLPDNPAVNIIESKATSQKLDLNDIFGTGGLFDKKFSQYEFRSGQLDMAEQVQLALSNSEFLVVEAGTGVGKSFAYLAPALIFANQFKKKTVVSTNTKNLQEQLFFKDLPTLKDILPLPFKAVMVKGRENYICERRWEELLQEQSRGLSPYEAHGMMYLLVWYLLTNTGDISENSSFDRDRHRILWRKICSDRYSCLARKCKFHGKCFAMKLRKEMETASLIVVNHSLLLADMRMDNTTLGDYEHLIIDEAHNLMASASKHLGFDIGYTDLSHLINSLSSTHRRKQSGYLAQLLSTLAKSLVTDADKEHIALLCNRMEERSEKLRNPITQLFSYASKICEEADSYGKLRIKELERYPEIVDNLQSILLIWRDLAKDLTALSNVLSGINSKLMPGYDIVIETINGFVQRINEFEGALITLANPNLDEYALWIESFPKPERNIPTASFNYAPIEVNSHLHNLLYKRLPSIVFTSATLSLRGSFKYFNQQSGLNLVSDKDVLESIVDSPFDYSQQAKLLIGSFLPEHKDRFFMPQALSCLEEVVTATEVGTMLLFTSYKDLNSVYDHLGENLYHRQRPFFAQGKGGSRTSILNEFKKAQNGVLLGTNSFWEGVDVQGESLSLLILFKLPFQPPSDPLVEALIEKLDRENRDSFMHYMLPNALLKLRQGFGRLIRSKSDRGIVLIMDSRVSKKRYGEYFKMVLPAQCVELKDEHQLLYEVSNFFIKS